MAERAPPQSKPRVLCVDDDRDIAEVVQAILVDEGYQVSCLYEVRDDALRRTVGQLEPDCLLLDGVPGAQYGSWDSAAWLEQRPRRIPSVMFTAHKRDVDEATEAVTERAQAAGFSAIIEKPFHLDQLLEAVATAVGQSRPFDRSPEAEAVRTKALVTALESRGATDIEPSQRREWASFRDGAGALWQVYWWQARGVYQLGRYSTKGKMAMAGQFTDLSAAIEIALPDLALRPSEST